MLLYRAQLREAGAVVVAVTVRRRGQRPLFHIIVRYAGADGRMLMDRGQLWAELPAGVKLTVAGYQQIGAELFITLRRVPPPARSTGDDGAALTDRFRIPLGLQAWGVTAVQGVRLGLQAVCRCRGGSLLVRGALRVVLQTRGAPFRLRIPFCRVLAVDPEAVAGLRWRVLAGVSGLQLRVESGGRVDGEVTMALRCEGRQPGPGDVLPAFGRVRELSGRVVRVAAEPAGDGHILVRGQVDLDLYWFDAGGLSRWTGRQAPFGALVTLDGLVPDDRLEATAVLDHLHQRVDAGAVAAHLIVTVTVTALRPELVTLGEGCYRLERVVGSRVTTIAVAERFFDDVGAAAGGSVRDVPGALPLPGPAGGWEVLTVLVSAADVAVAAGAARWSVRAAVSGTPAGEAPYPAPLKAAVSGSVPLGPRELLTVLPMLEQVDATGLRLRTALSRGPRLPIAAAPDSPPGAVACGLIALSGPVRSVLAAGFQGDGLVVRVWALVALAPGGLALVSGSVALPHAGRPLRSTAVPVLEAGEWRLQIRFELGASSS